MKIEQMLCERLKELAQSPPGINVTRHQHQSNYWDEESDGTYESISHDVNDEKAAQWGTSCLHILKITFGDKSDYYINFAHNFKYFPSHHNVKPAIGIMKAAFDDYSRGLAVNVREELTNEIFQDFLELARRALEEGNKDVAAVLACAALEDTLKRYAQKQGLVVDNKDLADIVNTLKSQGLVGGTLKNSLGAMTKIRNCAMHADWIKISEPDVSSVIGFVQQFLIAYF